MIDFSSVNLRIMSPDGKTVLAELQTIDRAGQGVARRLSDTNREALSSVEHHTARAARSIAGHFSMIAAEGNVTAGALKGVAAEAANIAFMFGTGGLIAGAVALTGLTIFNMFERTRQEIEATARKAREEIEKLARAGDLGGVARAMQYTYSGDPFAAIGGKQKDESDAAFAARKSGIVGIQAEIAKVNARFAESSKLPGALGQSARELAKQQLAPWQEQLEILISRHKELNALLAGLSDAEGFKAGKVVEQLRAQGQAGRDKTLTDLLRTGMPGATILGKPLNEIGDMPGFAQNMLKGIQNALKKAPPIPHTETTEELERLANLDVAADQIGETFGQNLARAIGEGVKGALRGGFGEGFKALTGAVLSAMGVMLQSIGEKALLAMHFMAVIKEAIARFLPEVGIPGALALIALGVGLQAAGGSMSGGGGKGRSYSGGGYGAYSPSATSYIGVLNPTPNTAGLAPAAPVTVNAMFIGKDDPRAQRELLEMISRAQRRGSTNG